MRHILFFSLLAILFLISAYIFHQYHYPQTTLIINNFPLTVDEARTDFQKEKGLAGRKSLAENQGMLFVYHHEQLLSFWMKGMLIPIDIIWLDKHYRVVYVLANLPPCPSQGECPIHTPPTFAQYVLETKAGFSQRHGVVVGTSIIA